MQFSLSPPIRSQTKKPPLDRFGLHSSNQSPHLATKWPFSFSSNYVSARLHAVNVKESDRWREIKELIALQARARARVCKVRFFCMENYHLMRASQIFIALAVRSALLATARAHIRIIILYIIQYRVLMCWLSVCGWTRSVGSATALLFPVYDSPGSSSALPTFLH
jgi:hypothetical protein